MTEIMSLYSRIEGNYKGLGKWYPGKIVSIVDAYNILYDDGEVETSVRKDLIRLQHPSSTTDLEIGHSVEGNYRDHGKWYRGKVIEIVQVFNILYDDGETEDSVTKDRLRSIEQVNEFPKPLWSRRDAHKVEMTFNGSTLSAILDNITMQIDYLYDKMGSSSSNLNTTINDSSCNTTNSAGKAVSLVNAVNPVNAVDAYDSRIAALENLFKKMSVQPAQDCNTVAHTPISVTPPIALPNNSISTVATNAGVSSEAIAELKAANNAFERKILARVEKLEDIIKVDQDEIRKQKETSQSIQLDFVELQKKYDQLLDNTIASVNNKIDSTVTVMKEQLEQQALSIGSKMQSMADEIENVRIAMAAMRESIQATDSKLSKTNESVALSEQRVKVIDGRSIDLTEMQEQTRHDLSALYNTMTIDAVEKVKFLETDKATRKELMTKADLHLLDKKVDVKEVARVDVEVAELSRKLASIKRELTDGFNLIEKNAQQRVENTAIWVLKQVKKSLKSDEGDGSGDIGKIKCLVCDQVVKQNVDPATGAGYDFYSHMRTKKSSHPQSAGAGGRSRRPNSPSKGATDDMNKASNATAKTSNEAAMQYDNDESLPAIPNVEIAQQSHQTRAGTASASALFKAGGGGDWDNPNPTVIDSSERDYVVDSMNIKSMKTKQTQSQDYFKDLEMKFKRGDHTLGRNRPLSAPAHKQKVDFR